jgi:hypothetical protein
VLAVQPAVFVGRRERERERAEGLRLASRKTRRRGEMEEERRWRDDAPGN